MFSQYSPGWLQIQDPPASIPPYWGYRLAPCIAQLQPFLLDTVGFIYGLGSELVWLAQINATLTWWPQRTSFVGTFLCYLNIQDAI